MSTTIQPLPSKFRALICPEDRHDIGIKEMPMPEVIPGSLIVKILTTSAEHSMLNIMAGQVPGLTLSTPFVPGTRAIGRVAAIGPDATTLEPGQLVILDPFIRGRDNPDVQLLWGAGVFGGDPRAIKLNNESWKDGMTAEYVRAPLENTYMLDEKRLLGSPSEGGLGYTTGDLMHIPRQVVAYGGLRGINLQSGETVIVAPATGAYSGAAVEVASAMGARVIAVGRNLEILKAVAAANPRVEIVQLKNNFEEDLAALQKFGTIDAYIDISPHIANDSTHVRSCMMALKQYGRVSLMGVLQNDIAIPYMMAVLKNITIRGQYMYEKEHVRGIIKLAESGVLKYGKAAGHEVLGRFGLDDWEKAFEIAKNDTGYGKISLVEP
ncbi:chaperonin 10-like protein [Tricladium varicosporioides]|nr:chaperonin 10-like protein [Hymenoscyphus varicosporioides]